MRTNTDLVVSFVQHQKAARDVICEDFMSDLPKEEVYALFDALTPPEGASDEECDVYKGLFVVRIMDCYNCRRTRRSPGERGTSRRCLGARS